MRAVRLVGVLFAAVAVLGTVYPFTAGSSPTAAPADGPIVLVDQASIDTSVLVAGGARVIVDYENGYQLMRMPPALAAELASTPGIDLLADRTTIDVSHSDIEFDTEVGEPSLAGDLGAASPGANILQFLGPIRSEWVSQLEAQGLRFDTYLDHFAFVVTGSDAAISAARAHPFLSWIGPYRAGYKVSADLLERSGEIEVFIMGFDGVDADSLRERVTGLGFVSRVFDYDPAALVASLPAGSLPRLAALADVLAIQEYRQPTTYDRIAGQIHNFHSAWDTRRSGLSTTVTGRSPGPDGTMYNADDVFEGAGILDTGLDEGDPNAGPLDFFGSAPVTFDRVTRFLDHTGASAPDGKCGSAHGTHVAGIIASDGMAWERYLIEDLGDTTVSYTDKEWHKSEAGVAPEAKISSDGAQNGNAFFCGNGLAVSLPYWDCQYLNGWITVPVTTGVSASVCGPPWIDGANVNTHNTAIDSGSRAWFVVNSNSWGGGTGNYNPTAFGADTRMNNAPERIIVFAAGNDGPGLNSISGEALLKNGLSVGASENFRPAQFDSDNSNLVAGFSSRGGPARSAGRIKPDVLAIGTSVVSLFSRGETLAPGFTPGADLIGLVDKYCSLTKSYCPNGDPPPGIPDYRYLQGTSMATPHAAGMAMLVREYLREVVGGNNPSSPYHNPPSYLVKAILINGAVRMDPNLYEYPGYDQGWGRIDLEQSLFPTVPRTNQFAIGQFAVTGTCTVGTGTCTGGGNSISGALNLNVASADVPMKVTLVWLDAPGDAQARNLDLRVLSPGGAEYHGDKYANGWSDPTATTYDTVNNVEQVEVPDPEVGTWIVEVRGVSIPTIARFAVVFSADIGPQATYKVDASTTYPTAVSVSPSGSATIPLTILNFGTAANDTIQLSSSAPAGITVVYHPSNAVLLPSQMSQDVLASITASAAISPGVYEFDLRAVSGDDPSPTPASDFVPVRVEVLSSPLPFPLAVTNATVDELDPSILTFTDAAVGGSHLFIAYRKTSRVSADGLTGGVNVWVAHAKLDANGLPVSPFTQTIVSDANEDPNDIRFVRLHAGNLRNRIALTWTGSDPSEANPDAASWARIAFLDPGAGPIYYSGSWTTVMIQKNEGTANPCNIARVSFPLFRAAVGLDPDGQLIYVWETLAYGGGCAGNPSAVVTTAKASLDGGATWGASTQLFPPPGNSNYYFFPNGVVDQNDVAWVFVYWRTPTGNDRDLTVRLLDNTGWSSFPLGRADYTILDTTDNVQWPAALSTSEGSVGNRVYATFTRDNLQADLKMYMIYTDKDYSRTVIPADFRDPGATSCGPGCTLSVDFSAPTGSGLLGPFGTSVSNANYDRRPILNIVQTTDGTVWLPHMENANPYRTPNLNTFYSNDGFASNQLTTLTSDAFAKGHQMTSTLTISGTPRVYEVYHATKGTVTRVNYEVYLLVYYTNWQNAPDGVGPLAESPAGTPNPVNSSATFRVTANFNDITTGNSNIAAAEYSIDTPAAPGSGIPMAAIDGIFDRPAEAGFADVDAGTLGWGSGECHAVFVRARDSTGNWGSVASYDQCTDSGAIDSTPPSSPVLTRTTLGLGPTFADVILTWDQAADEGQSGGTTNYRVYRATGLGGTLTQIAELPATSAATYSYTDLTRGDGDPNVYIYRIKTVDDAGNEAQSAAQAGKFTRPMTAGWHLLSVPVLSSDTSLTTVLQTLSWSRARTFVASDTADPWKAHIQVKGPQDFRTVDHTMSIWVQVSGADTFTVAGLIPVGPSISLQPGWNFIGFPSWRSTPYTVTNLKATVPQVTAVEAYDSLGPYYLRRMADADAFQQGSGYWVYSSGLVPVSWVVP